MVTDDLRQRIAQIPNDEIMRFTRMAQKRMPSFHGFELKLKNAQRFRQRVEEEYRKGNRTVVAFVNRHSQRPQEEFPIKDDLKDDLEVGQTNLAEMAGDIASSRQQLLLLMKDVHEQLIGQNQIIEQLRSELVDARQQLAQIAQREGEEMRQHQVFYHESINEISALRRSIASIQHHMSSSSGGNR